MTVNTIGLRTSTEAATALTGLLASIPAELPVAWRLMMVDVVTAAAALLDEDSWETTRAREVIMLAQQLAQAGAHAAWALAAAESPTVLPAVWPAAGLWHHLVWNELNAGWQRRLPAGANLGTATAEPDPVQPSISISETAELWLGLLCRDFLTLTDSQAETGLSLIPVGVVLLHPE